MNIEDEKKAFEAVFKNADLSKNSKGDYENNAVHWACTGWLTAKSHAEEMAKPGCILDKLDGLYRIRFSWHPKSFMKFHSEDDAKEWAKTNGYRVIK